MKKEQIIEVIAYGFVSLIFISIFTWIFHIFMAPAAHAPLKELFTGNNNISNNTQFVSTANSVLQRPYVTNEMDMGDFEGDFDRTIKNTFEGGIEATKDILNLAIRQFPFDWSNAPPSSRIFQEQNALFLEKDNLLRNSEELSVTYGGSNTSNDGVPLRRDGNYQREGFNNIDPAKDIITSYKPMCSDGMNTFSKDDSENFILDYYDKLGLVPEFKKREDGVYEVINTHEKNPKIVYEDEVTPESNSTWKPMAGNNDVRVQYSDNSIPSQIKTGLEREDSKGLQRMFGPGLQWQQYG
jgi:hypothetical protein